MKLNYDHIGKRIREKRVEIKMSQATLAELADISPQYISHIETGRKKASLGVIANVAVVLDTSVDYLLTGCAGLSKSEPADSVGLLSGLQPGVEKIRRWLYAFLQSKKTQGGINGHS